MIVLKVVEADLATEITRKIVSIDTQLQVLNVKDQLDQILRVIIVTKKDTKDLTHVAYLQLATR